VTQEATDAGVERLLDPHAPEVRDVARALRAAIRAELPDVVEEVDFANRLIAFGRSMKMRDLLFAVIPHTAHVNLQLADGVNLPDPGGLVEGTGKRIRHVKVRSPEAAASPAVRDLIRAQLARREHGP
jgi:hypothetical protein